MIGQQKLFHLKTGEKRTTRSQSSLQRLGITERWRQKKIFGEITYENFTKLLQTHLQLPVAW